MKTTPSQQFCTGKTGFTLVEMIGVLAIMAIIAATITPNALRALDRAAERAEQDTLHNLGEQVNLYLRDTGIAPTAANWTTVLAPYASLSPADLLTNRRQMARVYMPDPTASNQRAMFISSMRNGLALPPILAADFAIIWNTTDGNVPFGGGNGWGAWTNNAEYLIIERVNLRSVSSADAQTEANALHAMGEQIKLYLSAKGSLPSSNTWNQVLTFYGTLSPTDLLYARCQNKPVNPNDPALTDPVLANQQGYITRIYVPDLANKRAILISSMRTGVALPSVNNITNFFATIWNTASGNVPAAPGWNAWNANNIQFLVIERVSLQPELQDLPVDLTNHGASNVSYAIVSADGTPLQTPTNISPSAQPAPTIYVHPNQRLRLFSAAGGVNLSYTFVFSTTGKNFVFDGTNWLPQ